MQWPWEGEIVRVNEDRTWTFYRCSMCGRPLNDEKSMARGYGAGCLREHGLEKCERRTWAIRREDRRRFRNRLDVIRITGQGANS